MTDMKAGVWLSMLVIYFIFFILIVNSTTNLDIDDYNLNKFNDSNYAERLTADHICSTPRYYYGNDGEILKFRNSQDSNMECQNIADGNWETSCNALTGCSWVETNSTDWLDWFFGSSSESYYCEGFLNASSYGLTTNDDNYDITNHKTESSLLWGLAPIYSDAPCTDPSVLFDDNLCNMFSCTWSSFDYSETIGGSSIMNTFADIFSWRYDFGFTNVTINLMLTLLFVILPQIAIIIAGYFLLR